jgi:tetratricopeptide (TPR) repeat protein
MLAMRGWWKAVRAAAVAAGICWAGAFGADAGSCARGEEAFAARRYAAAQEALWDCVRGGSPDPQAAHHLALTYRETRNYDAGLRRADQALAQSGKSVDLLYLSAYLHFRMRRQDDSLRLLGEAYRINRVDWRVHQLFALNYVVLDVKDGALAEFQTAIALNPRNAELHYQLARFYHSENRIAESIEESNAALALFPGYPEAYENLGLCYEALSDKQRGVENFERAIAETEKLGLKNEWPFVSYAEFLIKQDEPEAAARALARALELNPASAKANYFMGRALRKLERSAEARMFLERAIKLDAVDPGAYFELGMLLMRLGDRAAAKPLLDRFQEINKSAARSAPE